MDGKKKSGQRPSYALLQRWFVVPAGAEETMTHDLDEVSSKPTETLRRGDL